MCYNNVEQFVIDLQSHEDTSATFLFLCLSDDFVHPFKLLLQWSAP